MSSALAIQNNDGNKRVLPLILEAKDTVLKQYPLLSGFAYKEYDGNPERIATEVAKLLEKEKATNLEIIAVTVHTGKHFRLVVPTRVSNKRVASQIQAQFDLRDKADTGGFARLGIRWVLVDSRIRDKWEQLPRDLQEDVHVIALTDSGIKISYSEYDTFEDIGIQTGTIFNLYAIQELMTFESL